MALSTESSVLKERRLFAAKASKAATGAVYRASVPAEMERRPKKPVPTAPAASIRCLARAFCRRVAALLAATAPEHDRMLCEVRDADRKARSSGVSLVDLWLDIGAEARGS